MPSRGQGHSLDLLATLWLKQATAGLTFAAARTHCWLMFSLSSTSTHPPTSSTSKAGKSWEVPRETTSFFLQFADAVKLEEEGREFAGAYFTAPNFFFNLISLFCLESSALWHVLQSLNLFPTTEGGRENKYLVGVSGEWGYCKLKHWTQNIPFSLGWGGGGWKLAVFQLICIW